MKNVEKLIYQFPYLNSMAQYVIFEDANFFKNIKDNEKIKIDKKDISILLLKKILEDKDYFSYTKKIFKNEIKNFCVINVIEGDIVESIKYNNIQIIKGLEELIIQKIITDAMEIKMYEELCNIIAFERFINDKRNDIFNISIDFIEYSINVKDLIQILDLPDYEFQNLYDNYTAFEYMKMPREHLIYAILQYFKQNKICDNYIVNNTILKRLKELDSNKIIDCESINTHLTTKDKIFKEIKLDESLKNEIISGIPMKFDVLQKAMYIYIKMCKVLTYDDEYYVSRLKENSIINKHKDPFNIENINLKNNRVTCFEFNLIYSCFLNELGINFCSHYKNSNEEAYGKRHVNIEFRVGKYLILADSVTSILQGDIMQAKLNQPLRGFKCLNSNIKTKKHFEKILYDVYNLFSKDDIKAKVNYVETKNEILNQYNLQEENFSTIYKRIEILVDKVNSTKMIGIDALSYIIQLRETLFAEEEQEKNFILTIIGNNITKEKNKETSACAIFTVNTVDFNNTMLNNYYLYVPQHDLMKITRKKLEKFFVKKYYEYVDDEEPRIPNLNVK